MNWIGPDLGTLGPWLTSEPKGLDLRGRVVVLHLFGGREVGTLATVEGVERLAWRFHDRTLQFVGVYCGAVRDVEGFHDKQEAQARALVTLLGTTVPTLLDRTGALAGRYGAQRLPTLVVLDAGGAHIGSTVGEPDWIALETTLERLLVAEAMAGALDAEAGGSIVLPATKPECPADELLWPASMARREDGLVAIAECGRHRVLVGRLNDAAARFEVNLAIGTGAAAFFDGPLDQAALCRPRQVVFGSDGLLWITDTGNHALRRVDVDADAPWVETLAGTGRCGTGDDRCAQELLPARSIDLRAPWQLSLTDSSALDLEMGDDPRPWLCEPDPWRVYPLEDAELLRLPERHLVPEPPPDLPLYIKVVGAPETPAPAPAGPEQPVRPGAGMARVEPIRAMVDVPVPTSPLGTSVEVALALEHGRWAKGSRRPDAEPLEVELEPGSSPVVLRVCGQLEDPGYGSCHVVEVLVTLRPEPSEAAPFVTTVTLKLGPETPPAAVQSAS